MNRVIITFKDGTTDETMCYTDAHTVIDYMSNPLVHNIRFGELVVRIDEIRSVRVVEE